MSDQVVMPGSYAPPGPMPMPPPPGYGAPVPSEVIIGGPPFAPTLPPPSPAVGNAELHRLTTGVQGIKTGSGFEVREIILLIVGGILAPLGLLLVLYGWFGAAHTYKLYEQIPYLISGGLLGLGLMFLGSFLYFSHWITALVKEHRTQSKAILDALMRLETVSSEAAESTAALVINSKAEPVDATVNGSSRRPLPPTSQPPMAGFLEFGPLVATMKGTMAHKPNCVVVEGKKGLRSIDGDDGSFEACKLCDPYSVV